MASPTIGRVPQGDFTLLESLKLGTLQIDLRAVQREAISVPSQGTLASVPNYVAALSSGTAIQDLHTPAFREFRRRGAGPVVVIDLQEGNKWRLPNLYFLTQLLATEPVISELVFTEARGGVDGYVVGSSHPDDLRRQIEVSVPGYGAASVQLRAPSERHLEDIGQAQDMANSYVAFLGTLPAVGANDDFAHGWVTPARIRTILGGLLNPVTIDLAAATLDEQDVRAVVLSPHRFLPATSDSRLSGLVDREAVALVVARAAVAVTKTS